MDIKNMSIDTIGLSARAMNGLHREKINTVGEMLNHSKGTLSRIRNLGKKTVDEIVNKIDEYRKITEDKASNKSVDESYPVVPKDYNVWISDETNRRKVILWLNRKGVLIEELELPSVKAFYLLLHAGYDFVYQIAFVPIGKIMRISGMDPASAEEIVSQFDQYIQRKKDDIYTAVTSLQFYASLPNSPTLHEILFFPNYHEAIVEFVTANDCDIEDLGFSSETMKSLISDGTKSMSDILFYTCFETHRRLKRESFSDEVFKKIDEYLDENKSRIIAFVNGYKPALLDEDAVRQKIFAMYKEKAFSGFTLQEILNKQKMLEKYPMERLKKVITKLVAEEKLECVEDRYYRVHSKFEDVLLTSTAIDKRSCELIQRRLRGDTLPDIAKDSGLTKGHVRLLIKRNIAKVRNQYTVRTGMKYFEEDYYRYLYETYAFDIKELSQWFGVEDYVWNYLDQSCAERGTKDLTTAPDDHEGLEEELRLQIIDYLHRNKVFLDGKWVNRKRIELDKIVLSKFCQNEVSYEEYIQIYNNFLEKEGVPFDEDLYYTDAVIQSRKNRLEESHFVLWKQSEKLRYYDMDGRDYTELFETLNFDSFENVEYSTMKFVREYPEILRKFDIRDHYELHNLLRKVLPEGSFHDFHCGRMPHIAFGEFDRDGAIMDILMENSPINQTDLVQLISEEYGYDTGVISSDYLHNFTQYFHKGFYSVDQKHMSDENREVLKAALTESFYFIDEIRSIYTRLIPGADIEEINGYNLKSMGFMVYTRYVLQNYPSLEVYFTQILTRNDVMDITQLKKRFTYVHMFSLILLQLKRNLQVIEYDRNQIINISRLEKAGITKDMIRAFCEEVYNYVEEGTYFNAHYLRRRGFTSRLLDIGFSDWFYSNLFIADDRFSYCSAFGNLILHKGRQNFTARAFISERILEHGCIKTEALIKELKEKYGCQGADKWSIVNKILDTRIYYDKTEDCFYANEELYRKKMEE